MTMQYEISYYVYPCHQVKGVMARNIDLVMQRGEKVEQMDERAGKYSTYSHTNMAITLSLNSLGCGVHDCVYCSGHKQFVFTCSAHKSSKNLLSLFLLCP